MGSNPSRRRTGTCGRAGTAARGGQDLRVVFSLVFVLPVQPTSIAILFFFILLSTVLLLCFSNSRSSSSSLPSPPRTPIIGNLHRLGSFPHHSLAALSWENSPLMLLHLGRFPALVISSKEISEEVLKVQDLAFASKSHSKAAVGVILGCKPLAFAPYGE
ncbi:hypothetical protein Taro_012853 [Colocasia esculenta]|uniref:Uncharacterized protein n=1 Tax=Colocasia esculenta TaxID=4460 RepID=A0A843U9Z5_COLES|nr:hypothetical protein [Colocasia esculenta]